MFSVLDLFSGIGGFALATEWAGGRTQAFCEQDKFCQRVLKKHWPDVPVVEDVNDLNLDTFVNLCYNRLSQTEKEEVYMVAHKKNYDEAVKMYDKGMSIQDVANFYGVTRQAMWMVLKRRGCVFRDNKKYGEENHFYRGGSLASDRSQNILELAIEKGVVIRSTHCEKCGDNSVLSNGNAGIQAHHADYNKPLDVEWLCRKCHFEWHKENTPKELEIELPTMTREEICSLGGIAANEKRWGKRRGKANSGSGIIGASTTVDLLTAGVP